MSIWSTVVPSIDHGSEFVEVATATAWNDRIRVTVGAGDDIASSEIELREAELLVANLHTAIDLVKEARNER